MRRAALIAVAVLAAGAQAHAQDTGPKATIELGPLDRGRPSLKLEVDGRSARVRRVRLNFPRGMRLRPGTRLRGAWPRANGRAVVVPADGEGTRVVSLTLRRGTISVARRLRRATRVRFTVIITDIAGRRTTRRVTARPSG